MNPELFLSTANVSFALPRDPDDRVRGATEPYAIHQLIADLFGQYDERPYLYRVQGRRSDEREVLILSRRPPDDPAASPARSFGSVTGVRTKIFQVDVPSGTPLDFEIRVNATKDIPQEKGRSQRVDAWDAAWREDKNTELTPHDVYRKYLERCLADAAEVLDARVTERGVVRARRHLRQRPITFVAANLIGTLRVQESAALNRIVGQGIGRSKAFGCGVLCLSRPGTVLPRRHPGFAKGLA